MIMLCSVLHLCLILLPALFCVDVQVLCFILFCFVLVAEPRRLRKCAAPHCVSQILVPFSLIMHCDPPQVEEVRNPSPRGC
jgi:hypothetical protein